MFCENCGHKLENPDKFCTKCGTPVHTETKAQAPIEKVSDEKWWNRLLKVLYIAAYLPLLFIIPIVWSVNSYSYYSGDTYGEAFWYSLVTLVIYLAVVRLIKIGVLYVALGIKPRWKREFKKLY